MRKLLMTSIVILVATLAIAVTALASEIRVHVQGERVVFEDQQPTLVDGRTLVPARGVFEMRGFEVRWDYTDRAVLLTNPTERVIRLTIDDTEMLSTADGWATAATQEILDVAPQLINGRTMIPLRAPVEAAGWELDWNDGVIIIVQVAAQEASPATSTIEDYSNATFFRLIREGYEFEEAVRIIEKEIFHASNRERQAAGLPNLVWCEILEQSARVHAIDMAYNNFVGHI